MKAHQFISRMNTVLRHNSIDRYSERERNGKINFKRLARAPITDSIFKKKTLDGTKKYNISILLDASGSMYDYSKSSSLINFLRDLIPVLDKIKGLDYEIVAFNALVLVIKPFGKELSVDEIIEGYAYALDKVEYDIIQTDNNTNISVVPVEDGIEYARFQNDDHEAVLSAVRRLSEQEGHRMIITMSDGVPNGMYDRIAIQIQSNSSIRTVNNSVVSKSILTKYEPISALKKAIKIASKAGIETVGIGIKTDCVKNFYIHSSMVSSSDEMFNALATHISKLIRKNN